MKVNTLYKNIQFLSFLVIAALLSSCSRNTYLQLQKRVNTDSIKTVYVVNNGSEPDEKTHRIQIDDILNIRNLQNPDLISGLSTGMNFNSSSLPYKIDPDSTVALPVIGRINLVGLTLFEAERKLKELYQSQPLMLRNPIINISIVNLKVTLLGEVGKQGNYLLTKNRTNLIEILGEAGGLNNRANKKTVQIIRGSYKNPQVFYVNLKDINSLASDKLYLQNNDIIYVEPNKFTLGADQLQQITPFISIVLILLNSILLINRISN